MLITVSREIMVVFLAPTARLQNSRTKATGVLFVRRTMSDVAVLRLRNRHVIVLLAVGVTCSSLALHLKAQAKKMNNQATLFGMGTMKKREKVS